MTRPKKTEAELADEVAFLRRRVAELEDRDTAAERPPPTGVNRLQGLLEAFDGHLYVCSPSYRIEFMNDPLIRRTGYDATGDLCYRALHGREDICPWCVNDRVFEGETVRWHVQSPRDGRWYYVINTPYHNEDGTVSKQSMMIDVTDRMETQSALLETRERYHELVENANCIILKLDCDGKITFINEFGQDFFGYPAERITGSPVLGTIIADLPANRRELARMLAEIDREPDRHAHLVNEAVRRDGDRRQIAWTNKPIRRDDRGVEVMCIGHDVTDLKRAEAELRQSNERLERMVAERAAELLVKNRQLKAQIKRQQQTEQALRESEEKYRNLVEHIGIGVTLISPSMEVLTLNRQMRQWVPGLDLSHPPKCYSVFNDPPAEGICSYCPTVRTLRDGRVHEAVTETPWKGKIRNFRIVSTPVRDEEGRISGAIEMVEDVTEKTRLQEQLRQSEARYRTIFETTGTATMVVEADNTISLVNTEFQRLSGRTKEAVEGRKTWKAFIAAEDQERMQSYHRLRRIDPDKAPRNYECRFINSRGELRDVFVTVDMQPGTDKSMVSLLDITQRKRAEEALRASEKKLRLLSSRLLLAQEEERKRIAGDLHDSIGQSLLLIKLKVENALQQTRRRSTQGQLIDAMNCLIPTIQAAVEEVRRICTGLRPSLLDDLGLVTTIRWCCRDFQANRPAITIEPAIEIREEEIPEALKIVIFRIIQEALNNIAKYSHADRVSLALVREEERVALSLVDNGVGFDAETVLSTGSRMKGLGISGMRERTELSGGRFRIESAVERGTAIHATWPLMV